MQDNDTDAGGETLSLDEAAAAYANTLSSKAVQEDDAAPEDETEGKQETDETEGDEPEAEEDSSPDDEDQAEDGEDDEPGSERGRFVADNAKVRLDDGTVLTIADLKGGNLRQADYTRKTQEVADLRKSVASQSERIYAQEQQLAERAELVENVLRAIVGQEPDPAMLDTDPVGYMKAQRDHRAWGQYLSAIQQQRQQSQQELSAEAARNQRERAESEWNALLSKAPEYRDQQKARAFADDIRKYGQETYGFSPDELRQIALDHRMALVLRDAVAQQKLQASKPKVQKKVEGRPPVTKGGKRLTPEAAERRRADDAVSRLRKTGRIDDAVAAYLANQKG